MYKTLYAYSIVQNFVLCNTLYVRFFGLSEVVMEYKDVLVYYLAEKNMSQAELARRINSPRSTVAALLNGRAKEPTLGKAKAIADALGVSLEEMANMTFNENEGDGGQQ